jgi:hypothetical protein
MAERILANVKVNADGCWLWQGKRAGGRGGKEYGQIVIYVNRKRTYQYIHRVSYITFKGAIPKRKEIRHICHVSLCANPAHLTVGTRKQNMLDRTLAGRKGNKITPAQVRKIRRDTRTQSVIAASYGITQNMVSKIRLRQNWKDVT